MEDSYYIFKNISIGYFLNKPAAQKSQIIIQELYVLEFNWTNSSMATRGTSIFLAQFLYHNVTLPFVWNNTHQSQIWKFWNSKKDMLL